MMSSSSYPQHETDWKSIFIRQLLNALAKNGQLEMSYCGPQGVAVPAVRSLCNVEDTEWLSQLMQKGGVVHLLRKHRLQGMISALRLLWIFRKSYTQAEQTTLFHINWLLNGLPLWGLKKPAVISVLGSDLGFLKYPPVVFLLRQLLKQMPCILTPNGHWMEPVLQKHFGDIVQIQTVVLGINKEWYGVTRNWNSIPKKWLAVLRLTENKLGSLFKWGESVFKDSQQHELHLFGPMQENITLPDWIIHHGSTHPKELEEKWFPVAAGLVTASRHDEGRPQVMLEAMAAGIPIIASKISAHEDFITHRKTGLLVQSAEEFCEAINYLSSYDNNMSMAAAAKKWVSEEVGTWEDCSRRYLDVYRLLLGETK